MTAVETAIGSVGRLGASSPVVIGGMVLTGLEVPDELVFGGRQELVVHRLLGGGRVVDAVGNDPERLTLKGRFVGPEAQARAMALARMREAGAPVSFAAAGISCTVWIAQFRFAYQAKGAVCSYSLVLERATAPMAAGAEGAQAGGQVGDDVRAGLSMIGTASSAAYVVAGQVGTIAGQVTPLAVMLGGGGAVARVTNALGVVNGVAQGGVNLAASPAAVGAMLGGLTQAGSGLTDVLGQTGANLENASLAHGDGLAALTANAGLASAAADTGGLVNRAAALVAQAGGVAASGPLVSA